jgi:hypothetical protein
MTEQSRFLLIFACGFVSGFNIAIAVYLVWKGVRARKKRAN